MGNFLTSEFQNPPSLSSLSPAPPHQDPKTQYGAFEQQRLKTGYASKCRDRGESNQRHKTVRIAKNNIYELVFHT